ncbi:VOC family protein [Halobellus captivus]|uniref:VOC family protein n=1 Tax=Halobellus captivus TaxID=2592614 RepID=UPI0011A2E5CB|nr:VOC family protein [Halobellus captivus]
MLTGFRRLGLEVKSLERARTFYEKRFGLAPSGESVSRTETARDARSNRDADPDSESIGYRIGTGDADPTTLVLRRPTDRPRGGVHTHYAFSTTPEAYPRWRRRLADLDPVEFSFGSSDSLYVYDPDGNCVEIGSVDTGAESATPPPAAPESDETTPPLTGIFEVVLEVTDLGRAEARYRRLGFEVVDRGSERRRVRLDGPVALELWEPQLGIADARGGVHVDLAFAAPNPDAAVEAGGPWPNDPVPVDGGIRVVDDDGHVLTFLRTDD